MFATISFKKKNNYLKIGFLVLLLFVWLFSIRNTINLKDEVNNQELFNSKNSDNMTQYYQLKDRLKNLDKKLVSSQSASTEDGQLSSVSELAAKAKVKVIAIPYNGNDSTKKVLSKTELQGNFLQLLHFLNSYEKQTTIPITSLSFSKPESFGDKSNDKISLIYR